MAKLHIDAGNGVFHCGATEGESIHFSELSQAMSGDVNAIDAICGDCLPEVVGKGIIISEPVDPDKVTARIDIIQVQSSTTPGKFGWRGNPMSGLPARVKEYVSDIILSIGYADSTLHQIYPRLFDGKKAPGCKLNYPKKVTNPKRVERLVWDNHSKSCSVEGSLMFGELRKGNPLWGSDIQELVDKACPLEEKVRGKARNKLGHPWIVWKDPPVSADGRQNPYIPFTPFQLSYGEGTTIPLEAYGLLEYAQASDELAKTLSELRMQVAGI